MINCSNFNEYVCAYIDNELNIKERLSFDDHIGNCTECKRELDEMVHVIGLCKSLPQHELPASFKEELHEKLVAVAERQGSEVIKPIKHVRFKYFKTFGAIAAGFLLVLLAGIYLKAGLFSPMKTSDIENNMAIAMEAPAAAENEKRSGSYAQDANAGVTGDAGAASKSMAAPEAAFSSSAETDRSAAIKNRDTAAQMYLAGEETASGNFSTITIITNDIDMQLQKIKQLALENNCEIVDNTVALTFSANGQIKYTNSGGGQTGYSGTGSQPADRQDVSGKSEGNAAAKSTEVQAQAGQTAENQSIAVTGSKAAPPLDKMVFNIPRTQYDQFVSSLNNEYGIENVQVGAIVTNDVTAELNGAVSQSIELDNRIQDLQKADSKKNASEIEKMKKQKESVDKLIDDLRLGNDFVNVTVLLKGK